MIRTISAGHPTETHRCSTSAPTAAHPSSPSLRFPARPTAPSPTANAHGDVGGSRPSSRPIRTTGSTSGQPCRRGRSVIKATGSTIAELGIRASSAIASNVWRRTQGRRQSCKDGRMRPAERPVSHHTLRRIFGEKRPFLHREDHAGSRDTPAQDGCVKPRAARSLPNAFGARFPRPGLMPAWSTC